MKRVVQALSKTDEGAFVVDERFRITFWNAGAQTILGLPAAQVTGRPCYEVLAGRDPRGRRLCQRYCQIAVSAAHGEHLPNLDVFAPNDNGAGRWINLTSLALPTEGRGSGHVIVHIFRDATRRVDQERFVEKVLAAARALQNGAEPPGPSIAPARPPAVPGRPELTRRERQVLLLLAQGLGTEAVTKLLSISQATARNHIQHVLEKLGVHTRLEAVAAAYRLGLVEVAGWQNSAAVPEK